MNPLKTLVFVGTEGQCHEHLGNGRYLAETLSESVDIEAEVSQDYDILSDRLAPYDAILCYTDIGELTKTQEEGLLTFVRAGGGFFGLHTAAASFLDCLGYHEMLNARFKGHSKYMDFVVHVIDHDDPITVGCDDFTVTDELYYLEHDQSRSQHLMQAHDPTLNEDHVMAFKHLYGKGRVFYFALGHDMAVLENRSFQEIIRRGALWTGARDGSCVVGRSRGRPQGGQ